MSHSVLIVEDDPSDAAQIAQIVSALLDCRVEFASDRYEAWSKVEATKYDALVVDLNLKGLHEGKLFLEMLRSRLAVPPGTIIVSTIGNEPTTRELKTKFPFIVESILKKDMFSLTETVRSALNQAVHGQGVTKEPPVQESEGGHLGRRTAIIVAIIGALGAIVAAILKGVFKWP